MALMDVFTHFSIIRRERRGIRPEEIEKKQISNNPLLNSKKRDPCGSPVVIPSIKA
jgi:hypothetical protein